MQNQVHMHEQPTCCEDKSLLESIHLPRLQFFRVYIIQRQPIADVVRVASPMHIICSRRDSKFFNNWLAALAAWKYCCADARIIRASCYLMHKRSPTWRRWQCRLPFRDICGSWWLALCGHKSRGRQRALGAHLQANKQFYAWLVFI